MSVNVIDTIKPKNGGSFPVVEAVDVAVTGSQRLPAALDAKANASDVAALGTALAGKANQSDIVDLRTSIASKAAQSSLDATNVVVASKAAQSSLDALSVIVDRKADKRDYDNIFAAIDTKADKTYVDTSISGVEAEITEGDTALQNQINQIEISASAEAVVAPEVAAARVDADGVSHDTLKARCDSDAEKVAALQSDMSQLSFAVHEWEQGSINFADGTLVASTERCRTEAITNILSVNAETISVGIMGYLNGAYIGMYDNGEFTVPSQSAILTHTADLSSFGAGYEFRIIYYGSGNVELTDSLVDVKGRNYVTQGEYNASRQGIDFNTDMLLKSGNRLLKNRWGGTGYNGGTVDTTNGIISIEADSTGNSSYLQAVYPTAEVNAYLGNNKKIAAVLDITAENYALTNSQVKIVDMNGTLLSTNVTLITEDNGHYVYYIEGTTSENSERDVRVTVQISNTSAVVSAATITVNDVYVVSEEFSKYIAERITSDTNNYETVTITVGTGKQYTSLRTALEACTDGSASKRYVVEYYSSGVQYDVINDLTAEELGSESSYQGLRVPAYTKLIGMNRYDKNVISLVLPVGTSDNARTNLSTLNLDENGEIENLTVVGKNCRYAIHDDFNSYNPDWKEKVIKKCHIISDYTYFNRAYGAGYRSGMKWRFEDCIFENKEIETGYAAFTAHNNTGFTKPSELEFVNCQFIGGYGAGFGSLNAQDSNVISTIKFYGCTVTNTTQAWKVSLFNEGGESRSGCQTSIAGCCNNFGNDDVAIRSNDQLDYSDRKTLTLKIS